MRWGAVVVSVWLAAACSADGVDREVAERARAAAPDEPVATPTSALPSTTTATTVVPTPVPTTAPSGAPPVAQPEPSPAAPPPPPGPPSAGPVSCAVPAGYPEPWVARPRYTARLVVPPGAAPLTGEVDVRFTPDVATDRLVFRLWANAPRLGRAGGRMEITASSVEGVPTPGSYEPGGAAPGRPGTVFSLPGGFPAGKTVSTRLEFRLVMPGPVNDRVSRIGSTLRLGSVLPTLAWVRGDGWHTAPAVDNFAESATSEAADWDVRIEAPPGSATLATGVEIEPGRFVASAVRDFSATVAPMRIAESPAQGGRTTVAVGVAANARGDAAALARKVAATLDGMAARFGEYPHPRLTVAVSPSLSGGIEFPMHIHFGSSASSTSLVHEVAHQWFYAVAGNDQHRDPWLDEALATYAEARFNGRLAAQRARALPAVARGNLGQSMAFWRSHPGSYHRAVYVGGLQALGALADRLGGYEVLDCALRRYHRDRAFTVSRPADFFDAVVRQTGVDPRPVLAPFGIG